MILRSGFFPRATQVGMVLGVWWAGGLPPAGLRAADAATAAEPRDYVLFVGLDVTVERQGVTYRLEDVAGGNARLRTADQTLAVPVRRLEGLGTVRETVVTTQTAQLGELRLSTGFSAGSDPTREAMRHEGAMANWATENANRVASAEATMETAGTNPTGFEGDPSLDRQIRQERVAQATERLQSAVKDSVSEVGGPTYLASTAAAPGAPNAGMHDSLEVSVDVSAPVPVANAYAVLLSVLRLPQAPQTPGMSIAVRDLPALTAQPRRVTLTVDNLPRGFTTDRCEVHVYHAGRELATNLSEKRIALTRAEAFQYLVLRHAMDHAGEDLAPRLVPHFLPPEFAQRVPVDQRTRAAEVQLDADGRVLAFTLERAGSHAADSYIADVLRDALFYPALLKGKPVPTTTSVVLAEFVP